MMYRPYAIFVTIGTILLAIGLIPFVHYIYLYLTIKNPNGPRHLQFLIVGGVLLTASFISFTLGLIADLIRVNRILIEEVLDNQKNQLYK